MAAQDESPTIDRLRRRMAEQRGETLRELVHGETRTGPGAAGVSETGTGVLAFSRCGPAVAASSVEGDGIRATTSGADRAAILAANCSRSSSGVAVAALGEGGIGLFAAGARAPLQLDPAGHTGPPSSHFHQAGEIILDAKFDLYLCKVTGLPGKWTLLG